LETEHRGKTSAAHGRDAHAPCEILLPLQLLEMRSVALAKRGFHSALRPLFCGFFFLVLATVIHGAEIIPPVPSRYFNDNAGVVSAQVAQSLNQQLEDFEKATSSQIVVAIYPKMQADSSLEDYAQHIFEAWKPGQKKLSNGAVLLVFVQDHKMRIHTGYGLEGALPDVICKRILGDEIAPRLKAGDFSGGMTAGVNAMIAAARGEYKGTGTTHQQMEGNEGAPFIWIVLFWIVVVIIAILSKLRRSTATQYGAHGRQSWNQGWYFDSNSGGSSGGGWSGGGGFSGGGGSSGGGGASGSW
jgi:uncharacterized protein